MRSPAIAEPVRISLTSGKGFAVVDAADGELVSAYRWWRDSRPNGRAYAKARIMRGSVLKSVYMHVLLMGQPGIDHINGDGLDNRRANLRLATKSQNGANLRPYQGCTSPFKGVYRYQRGSVWVAQIQVDGCKRSLGRFPSEEDAARAYDAAALAAWGEYALLNFPAPDAP